METPQRPEGRPDADPPRRRRASSTSPGPNVTADAAALCLKSGNAIILRGGSEAIRSNVAISGILQEVLRAQGLCPRRPSRVVPMTDREAVYEMLQLDEFIDVIIPRGGEELIRGCCPRLQDPRPQALQRGLPRLRRPGRRSGHGRSDLHERQDAASRRLQRHGDPPRR